MKFLNRIIAIVALLAIVLVGGGATAFLLKDKILSGSGVVVQHPDSTLEAMPHTKAAAFLAALEPEARALYERIESGAGEVKEPAILSLKP